MKSQFRSTKVKRDRLDWMLGLMKKGGDAESEKLAIE